MSKRIARPVKEGGGEGERGLCRVLKTLRLVFVIDLSERSVPSVSARPSVVCTHVFDTTVSSRDGNAGDLFAPTPSRRPINTRRRGKFFCLFLFVLIDIRPLNKVLVLPPTPQSPSLYTARNTRYQILKFKHRNCNGRAVVIG